MGYNLLIDGVYCGYNPLILPWAKDIQVVDYLVGGFNPFEKY